MPDNDFERFMKVLDSFAHAMLVTVGDDEFRARPMAIGDTTPDARIRFITRDDSAKLRELDDNPRVLITAQGDDRFLSIVGRARLSKSRELVDATWKVTQAPWFCGGRSDPHVVVLEVVPLRAEFWDRSRIGLVKLLLYQARAALRSRRTDPVRVDATDSSHGSVDFSDKPL